MDNDTRKVIDWLKGNIAAGHAIFSISVEDAKRLVVACEQREQLTLGGSIRRFVPETTGYVDVPIRPSPPARRWSDVWRAVDLTPDEFRREYIGEFIPPDDGPARMLPGYKVRSWRRGEAPPGFEWLDDDARRRDLAEAGDVVDTAELDAAIKRGEVW